MQFNFYRFENFSGSESRGRLPRSFSKLVVEPGSETRCVSLPSCYLEDSFPYPEERTGAREGKEFKSVGLLGGGDREWRQLGLGQQGPEPSNRPRRGPRANPAC